jgi:hypothetical protein
MLRHLLNHPAVVNTLDEISEALNSDVRDLDTDQCFRSDVSVQLALFAAGVGFEFMNSCELSGPMVALAN